MSYYLDFLAIETRDAYEAGGIVGVCSYEH